MSYRNRTLSEKKRIYKKLGLVIAAILVVCIALAIALRPTKGNASHNASGTQAVEGMIEVDGVKYVPKKNIETYLFMGIDNMGKVQKVTDYEGAGRCDVVMLMVRDRWNIQDAEHRQKYHSGAGYTGSRRNLRCNEPGTACSGT